MKLSLIGIGCGNPDHLTLEAIAAMNRADLILLPDKGEEKAALDHLRQAILARHLTNPATRIRHFAMPARRKDLPYGHAVADWHDAIADAWKAAIAAAAPVDHVALLVWGDPSLYDSSLRIASRIDPAPEITVIAGITALSALTAAHAIALNDLARPVAILPARHLRDKGWPEGFPTLAVFLDDGTTLANQPEDAMIWWGAYLGMDAQTLIAGRLAEMRDQIAQTRAALRARHGWIMDLYLLHRDLA